MKGYKLLIFFVLFIGFLIYIQPDKTGGAASIVNDFIQHIENGQWKNVCPNLLIVPDDARAAFPQIASSRLNAQWVADVMHDGKWGSARRVLGIVEAERLATVFRLPHSRLKAMASPHGYLVFAKNRKGQWQLLSCRCNLIANHTRPDHDTPLLLGYENGIVLVERDGRMARLTIDKFFQDRSQIKPASKPQPEPEPKPQPAPKTPA